MAVFQYKAMDSNGRIVSEKIEVESELEAFSEIEKTGLSLIEIKQVNPLLLVLTRRAVKKKDLAEFAKSLSYLIETGIPLHRGVEIIGEQTRNTYFKSVIQQIIRDIKEGQPLSQACSKYPKVFPESMVFQLKAAESGGFMHEALINISSNFERDANFNKQVRGAMMYPCMVLLVAIGIVYFMLTMVVPKMTGTLKDFGADLPTITKVIMAVSDAVQHYWYTAPLIVGVSIYLFRLLILNVPERRLIFHKLLLKMPVVGNLILNINVARMTRAMGSLLSSGVPIDDTLENIKSIISNKYLSLQIEKIKSEIVEQGFSLSRALEEKAIFPRILVQITKVGEESGSLEDVLLNLSNKLEDDVSELLKTTTSLINPLIMVFIGAIVGVIVMALFLPMFSLIDKL